MNSLLVYWQHLHALIFNGGQPELGYWIYPLIAVLVAFEGPATTLLAAAAAAAGLLHPAWVFGFAAAGNLTSDLIWYSLGRAGKIDAWKRFSQKRGLDPEVVPMIQTGINKHAMKIMFFAKLTMSFMIPTLITAGLSKVPYRKWLPADFAGEMLWTGSLLLIGYNTGEAIQGIQKSLSYITIGCSIVFVLFLLWMGRRVLKKMLKRPAKVKNSPRGQEIDG